MGSTREVESALSDTRQAPLGALSGVQELRRIRPVQVPGSERVPVAAFNASL